MSWGYRIMIIYILFVSGIVFLVVKSSRLNQDLVTENYYEQELRYQDKIEETERANALSAQVQYNMKGNVLNVIFPKEMAEKKLDVQVLVYCTADKNKDFVQQLFTHSGQLRFDIPRINKGLHEIKVTWKADGLSYYHEHKMMFQ